MPKGLYQKYTSKSIQEASFIDYQPTETYERRVATWGTQGDKNETFYYNIGTSYGITKDNKNNYIIHFPTQSKFKNIISGTYVCGMVLKYGSQLTPSDIYGNTKDLIWEGYFNGSTNGSYAYLYGLKFYKLLIEDKNIKNSYVGEVIADVGTLPNDGYAKDGYWYTFIKLVSEMSVNINGVWKNAYDAWANINGVWKPQNEMKANVNGIWR